jgi:pimeloyl-ACP methyl ester carboxylesterase
LGERAHLRDPVPSLATHIDDVVGLVESEELQDVVLVGHSYGGMVITGAADRLRSRLRRLVYIDAPAPADGQDFAAAIPGLEPERAEQRRAAFRSMSPDGVWLPVMPPSVIGVTDPQVADWFTRRSRPHPLRTWLEPVKFDNGGHAGIPKTYVLATNPPTALMGYPVHGEVAKQGGEWTYREVACGHQIPALRPDETLRLLIEALG